MPQWQKGKNMAKTIGELSEEIRIADGAEEYLGHKYMDLLRFDSNTKHMIIYRVLRPGDTGYRKGDMIRLFLSPAGYEKAIIDQDNLNIKIVSHAKVYNGGHLVYDDSKMLK